MTQQQKFAIEIIKQLRTKGFEAYFAGGCVRDMIMNVPPVDIDIATNAEPDEIIKIFPKTFQKGKAFGVVSVLMEGMEFEVATFRAEGPYSDGRRPDHVSWTTAQEDALRRDFTINGMFYDPVEKKVIDYVGGQEDLKRKVVRTIGRAEKRFEEDKLRMLRAVRFSAYFDYELEIKTRDAIRQHSTAIHQVSPERIHDELIKILTGPHPAAGIELMDHVGLLQEILPEVVRMKGVAQPPQFHPEGDVYVHTLLLLRNMKNPSPELAMAGLLHDIGKPDTFTVKERIRFDGHVEMGVKIAAIILKRLRFSGKETDLILAMIGDHLRFIDAPKMRESKLKKFLRQERFDLHLELHRLDCLASHGMLDLYDFCRKKLSEIGEEKMKPTPLITGHDLIELGLKPGPIFSKILTYVEDLQLEEKISNKEEALKEVKKFLKQEKDLVSSSKSE